MSVELTKAERKACEVIHAEARLEVRHKHGSGVEFLVGPVLYRALVAERILIRLAMQDGSVGDERVRTLLTGIYDVHTDHFADTP